MISNYFSVDGYAIILCVNFLFFLWVINFCRYVEGHKLSKEKEEQKSNKAQRYIF